MRDCGRRQGTRERKRDIGVGGGGGGGGGCRRLKIRNFSSVTPITFLCCARFRFLRERRSRWSNILQGTSCEVKTIREEGVILLNGKRRKVLFAEEERRKRKNSAGMWVS